jgi:DNA-binding CsgD family transcriptional regulator
MLLMRKYTLLFICCLVSLIAAVTVSAQGFTSPGANPPPHGAYSLPFAQTEAINAHNNLDLTPREEEIFTMLLTGKSPKEIAYTLKISYYTVLFHQKNLYRKLGIQSRAELFARYNTMSTEKTK